MNIYPLGSRVLIERVKEETKTSGGIIIPDSAKEKPVKGVVIAVGPGTKREPMELSVHDHVLFGKYNGTEIEINNKKFLFMNQNEVIAIIDKEVN